MHVVGESVVRVCAQAREGMARRARAWNTSGAPYHPAILRRGAVPSAWWRCLLGSQRANRT
eukprot:1992364-Pyramimonas_sp.AAC.2